MNTKKILLVDDEPDITIVFSMALEDKGFKVDVFSHPLLALSEFKKGSYDLIIRIIIDIYQGSGENG